MAHVTNIFANEVSWVFGLLVISWRCNYCDYDDDHHRLRVIELQGSILQVTKHLRSHPPRGTHARTCAIIINVLRYYYHHRKFYLSISMRYCLFEHFVLFWWNLVFWPLNEMMEKSVRTISALKVASWKWKWMSGMCEGWCVALVGTHVWG